MKLENQAMLFEKKYFIEQILFTPKWWVLVILTFFPWAIWWRFADKKKLTEMSIFGLLILVQTMTYDEIGAALNLWDYPVNLVPYINTSLTANLTIFTVIHMLIYQYYPQWKRFIIANIILASLVAFIVEPVAVYFDYYLPIKWKYIYSFPIYIAKALICKWFTEGVIKLAERAKR